MTRQEYCARVQALAQDPESFVRAYNKSCEKRGINPTHDNFVQVLNKMFNLGALTTTQVLILGIYQYPTNVDKK